MTMNFDMTSSNLGNAVNNSSAMAPNKIHDVLFKGVEYSVSKDGKWEMMKMKFQGISGGFFTGTIFGLGDDCEKRKQTQYGENPSQYENLMMTVKHLLSAVSPEILEKIQNKEIVFTPKSKSNIFKQYVEFLAETLKVAEGTQTQIKLVPDRKGQAAFPAFPFAVSKSGEVYIKTNFIGSNLSFTTKELETMARETAAKPTVMPDIPSDLSIGGDTETTTSTDDLMNMDF